MTSIHRCQQLINFVLILSSFVSVAEANVPLSHLKGLDELFPKENKIYSPMIGLLAHETWIPTQYEAKSGGPLSELLNKLFIKIPNAEIQPSHLGKNPGAHLTPSVIGKFFVEFEKLKTSGVGSEEFREQIRSRFMEVWTLDEGYQEEINQTVENFNRAEKESAALKARLEIQKVELAKAEEFKKLNLNPICSRLKKIKNETKKDSSALTAEVSTELETLEAERIKITQVYEGMKQDFISGDERSAEERTIKRLREANDVFGADYRQSLDEFVDTLVSSFFTYEVSTDPSDSLHYATTTSLLSYLWMKYTEKSDFRGYFAALSSLNFLTSDAWDQETFYQDYYSGSDYVHFVRRFSRAWHKQRWVIEHLPAAFAMTADVFQDSKAPDLMPFSYIRWARYTLFPDCCENALHHIFGFMAFNPTTGLYDYRILEKLRDQYYPKMSQAVIDYFKTHVTKAENTTDAASSAWIKIVSKLNAGYDKSVEETRVHYEKKDREVSGPYSNLVRVINRLLGVEEIKPDRMVEIFSRVKEISGLEVVYSTEGTDAQSYGAVVFGIGKNTFVLKSYRPVHVTFNLIKQNTDQISERITKIISKKASKEKSDPVHAFRYKLALEYMNK